jgi:hypothetical protein
MNRRLCISLAIIAAGLALRAFGYRLGLPFVIVKYGGSVLWGAMVYFLVAASAPRMSDNVIVGIALAIAVNVELFRLVHTPALDAFRLSTVGALLLGRVFSLWNIVAYVCGVLLALVLDLSGESRLRRRRA